MENISVYYSPVGNGAIVPSMGTAYHMTIVYTNDQGISYAATGGPSTPVSNPGASEIIHATSDTMTNTPSAFGTLIAAPNNGAASAFNIGQNGEIITNDGKGNAYYSQTLTTGADLSSQFNTIVRFPWQDPNVSFSE